MVKAIVLAVALAASAPSSAVALDLDPAARLVAAHLCVGIEDDADRLECFDRLFSEPWIVPKASGTTGAPSDGINQDDEVWSFE